MKFTLSWLKKHLETSANLDEILLALTDLGLEVENVVDPIEALLDRSYQFLHRLGHRHGLPSRRNRLLTEVSVMRARREHGASHPRMDGPDEGQLWFL